MVKSKNFLIVKHFEGEPKESDFKLVEEELPPLKDGGETRFLSRFQKCKQKRCANMSNSISTK